MLSLLFLFLSVFMSLIAAGPIEARAGVAFFDPTVRGGSWLNNDTKKGLGEPLNVIISGLSSRHVLTSRGFLNYARSIGFSTECLGIHLGNPQYANLGDGNGWIPQAEELRYHYGNIAFGTCYETLVGGNHFRIYRQDGRHANSGALFLAVSQEMSVASNHRIDTNGYNNGRDALVSAAEGTTTYAGILYSTTVEHLTGVMSNGSVGVNHEIPIDGDAVLLTVTIIGRWKC